MMSKTTKKINVIQVGNDNQRITEAQYKTEAPVYAKPILKNYGDVRDVTLGPTGPPTESGGGGGGRPRQN